MIQLASGSRRIKTSPSTCWTIYTLYLLLAAKSLLAESSLRRSSRYWSNARRRCSVRQTLEACASYRRMEQLVLIPPSIAIEQSSLIHRSLHTFSTPPMHDRDSDAYKLPRPRKVSRGAPSSCARADLYDAQITLVSAAPSICFRGCQADPRSRQSY